MAKGMAPSSDRPHAVHRGQEVIAGHEAIGEVVDLHTRDGVTYVHVLRFGPGLDQIYIPTIAIKQVVGNHVYLGLTAAELLGQAWHERPEDVSTPGASSSMPGNHGGRSEGGRPR